MKTFSPGLSDSIASVIDDPRPCPHCDSSSHIAGGLCVGCLLEAGLDPADESADSLDALLSEINLPDQNWRLGNYEILEEIGRGGMGVIYRARQRHSRRIVAVKRILSYHSDSRETLARFRREAQAAASLDHPNILPIFEVSESEDGLPFFSMKFAPGGTLQQVALALRNDPRQCVALVAKIARAVQYAHSRGILHRDLKPGNILLDGRGEPLVSDFGLAKWLDTTSDLTRTLTIFGTPGYIAPEQASQSAAELKPTADVYSLGAILFDLLAGRPPFLGAHALSVIRQAAESPAPKLRTLSKLADRDLETICSRCLDREPSARYRSAHDLATDLERWLEGRPIIARRVLPPVRVWRWSKRNPALALAGVVCLALAIAVAGRQIHSRKLEATVRENYLATHSLAVLPLLDLDNAAIDSEEATKVTLELLRLFNRTLKARILNFADAETAGKTVAWREADLRRAALQAGGKAFLIGTIRKRGSGNRIVLNIVDASDNRILAQAVTESQPSVFENTIESLQGSWVRNTSRMDLPRLRADPSVALKNEVARNYFLSADDLLARRDPENLDRAIACYRKVVANEPEAAIGYASLAATLAQSVQFKMEEGRLREASELARRAVELEPTLAIAHRAQAVCFYELGRFEEAIEACKRALELDPTYARTPSLLGAISYHMGRPDLSLRWYYWAERAQNQPGDYSCNIAAAWMALEQDDAAERALGEANEFRPELPYAACGLAELRLLQHRWEEAWTMADQNALRFPSNLEARQVAAEAALLSGRFDQAEKHYRFLLSADRKGGPFSGVSYLSGLGWICLKTGREDEARALLAEAQRNDEEALRTAPLHPRRLYSRAGVAAALGETDEALSWLEKAMNAGWIKRRFVDFDPLFANFHGNDRFEKILFKLSEKTEELRRNRPTDNLVTNISER